MNEDKEYKWCEECTKHSNSRWCENVEIEGNIVCACKHEMDRFGVMSTGTRLYCLNEERNV